MKKFQFKLERVLDIRNLQEDISRNHLLQEKNKAKKIERELDQLNSRQEDLYHYIRKQDRNTTVGRIQANHYLHFQRQQIKQVEGVLSTQQEEVDKCHADFCEKRKKREILEWLKDKDYRQYRQDLLRKEQQIVDEISQRLKGGGWFE